MKNKTRTYRRCGGRPGLELVQTPIRKGMSLMFSKLLLLVTSARSSFGNEPQVPSPPDVDSERYMDFAATAFG